MYGILDAAKIDQFPHKLTSQIVRAVHDCVEKFNNLQLYLTVLGLSLESRYQIFDDRVLSPKVKVSFEASY